MTWRVPRHVFQACAPSPNSTKYRADDLCGNLICEYFCWMLGDPHFFFGRSLPFLIFSIILNNKKNLSVGSINYFSYTIQIGSNWHIDTGVRDLEVTFFKANSTWINDIGSNDLSNRPIHVCAVLNTHNLDMILQLKYMSIVMNPARITSSLEILKLLWFVMRLIFKTSSVTPDFFYVFNIILSFSNCSQTSLNPM